MFAAGAAGLVLYLVLFQRPWAAAIGTKAIGGDSPCPWGQLLALPWAVERFQELQSASAQKIRFRQSDDALQIQLFDTPTRPIWIPTKGDERDGKSLLAYVLAEQEWLAERSPDLAVRPGDVVMDVGAHVGTFGDDALRRGAAKVIMVEPDPVNQECIRRNYAAEIASGRVVLVPEGAWSSESSLDFHVGIANSGSGSLVTKEAGSRTLRVPVRPIDDMVANLNLDKLDFVKMDIEGAEREALKGGAGTLRRFKPRLMLDAYHLSDDSIVLPAAILAANPAYRTHYAACGTSRHQQADDRLVPYSIFFY